MNNTDPKKNEKKNTYTVEDPLILPVVVCDNSFFIFHVTHRYEFNRLKLIAVQAYIYFVFFTICVSVKSQ